MKILRIGDPHVKPSNINESDDLMIFVNDMILKHKPDRVELLGDLFHTHSILRLEVIDFWNAWLDTLSEASELFVLTGNHDQSGDYSLGSSALTVFQRIKKKKLQIVENAVHKGIFAYIAYHHDHEEFIAKANGMANDGARVLVCHQTFNGSKYESGMYAPGGIDPALLNYKTIISGHIHSTQYIKNGDQTVYYPGTPKWDTLSDANESKGIWLYEHDDQTGAVISETCISTNEVCMPIFKLAWEENGKKPDLPERGKIYIDLVGSSQWVIENTALLKGKAHIQSKITDKVKQEIRDPGKDFLDFLTNIFDEEPNRLKNVEYARELKIV